ncbi:MAG: sodium/proton-translocating pyrophosphatase [bacterium]|nr:sodium/proton-translocating pyrophosphatase [bacterium]
MARLDMVGNTTKALTKGFAIATAVIAAVALHRSYIDTVAVKDPDILTKGIQVNLPEIFIGLLIGGAVPFLFSSFAIRAVSRAAVLLVEEVRRQFREIPGIMEYRVWAKRASRITRAAWRFRLPRHRRNFWDLACWRFSHRCCAASGLDRTRWVDSSPVVS